MDAPSITDLEKPWVYLSVRTPAVKNGRGGGTDVCGAAHHCGRGFHASIAVGRRIGLGSAFR